MVFLVAMVCFWDARDANLLSFIHKEKRRESIEGEACNKYVTRWRALACLVVPYAMGMI